MQESRWVAEIKASSAPGATLRPGGSTGICAVAAQAERDSCQVSNRDSYPQTACVPECAAIRQRIPHAQPAASFASAFSSASSLAQTSSFLNMYSHPLFLGSIWGYLGLNAVLVLPLILLPVEIPKLHRWAICL